MLQINNCAATITSVNLRKENKGKSAEKTDAFDIDFTTTVHAECIKGLYNDFFIKAMWSPDGKALNVAGITSIVSELFFEKGEVVIKEGAGHETTYTNCKVKSFKMRPRQFQMIEVKFQVQYHPEDEEEVVPAYRCLKIDDGVQITIEANNPDPTKNKKPKDDNQLDAFPNGKPEDDEETPDPFEGSDLETDDPEEEGDTTGNVPESGFEDFPEDLDGEG